MIKPQKVKHLHLELEKKAPNIDHIYMVTEKVDGIFAYIDYTLETGWGTIHSRAMRELPSLYEYTNHFAASLGIPTVACRILMEVYIPDTPFHILNGIFNRSKGDCHAGDAHFLLHDIIFPNPVDSSRLLPYTALERFNLLKTLNPESSIIKIAELLNASSSPELWRACFNRVVAEGGEGVVLKQADAIYQPDKRNSSLMKIKEEVTVDLLCVRIYETVGTKGHDNLNLVLKSKDGLEITVRVPKPEEADSFIDNPELIVGKVVQIKAMKKLSTGLYREPRYEAIRYDKTIAEID